MSCCVYLFSSDMNDNTLIKAPTTSVCFAQKHTVKHRERDNFIEINRKHDDTCTNKNYNKGLCRLIQGDLF